MQYIDNIIFMTEALNQAYQAFAHKEVPVGAIVVDQHGTIIGKGFNKVELKKTQSAHAEFEAINQACAWLNNWRLSGCTIIVTLEPCAMCISLIMMSRLSYLVYGASSSIFGYQNDQEFSLHCYKNNNLTITKGILNEEITQLMKKFFITKRNSNDSTKK